MVLAIVKFVCVLAAAMVKSVCGSSFSKISVVLGMVLYVVLAMVKSV